MRELIAEPQGELVGVVSYAVLASVLTALGTLAELASVQNLSAGQLTLGLWEVAAGFVLLYAGLTVIRTIVVPRFHAARSR
ncbi:MAG: hypothetical protein ABEJ40_01620 [Haloarculaceae archaeon]